MLKHWIKLCRNFPSRLLCLLAKCSFSVTSLIPFGIRKMMLHLAFFFNVRVIIFKLFSDHNEKCCCPEGVNLANFSVLICSVCPQEHRYYYNLVFSLYVAQTPFYLIALSSSNHLVGINLIIYIIHINNQKIV